ncbi:MAG: YihY/virulence factor BrkB family protein [Lachnospiraceae bacterium]|nr:YihY/virulence factor BrkB family protein [Lachnospiraceae bacterium]
MIKKAYRQISDFLETMRDNNTSTFAAGAAFFVFLSIIPVMIIVISILPYTRISGELLTSVSAALLPSSVAGFLADMLTEFESKSVAVISLSALTALWISGKGVFALINGLNAVNHVKERRPWVILRLRASGMTVMLLALMLVSLIILVLGNILNRLLTRFIPDFALVLQLLLHFRFLFVWAFFTFFFQLIYFVLPSKHMIFKEQFPGALFSGVGWSVFSWGFSLYLEYFNAYSLYGSLATVIVGLIWLYFCMYILLTGAQINIYFQPMFKAIAEARRKKRELKKNGKTPSLGEKQESV